MLRTDLFLKTLIEPAKSGADTLYVVSGYASPNMVDRHIQYLREKKIRINVKLIIGMTATEGIGRRNHLGFIHLMERVYRDCFECRYLVSSNKPVHSKAYAWFSDNVPACGFLGSANYSQNAFFEKQQEVMELTDPSMVRAYYEELLGESYFCTHSDVEGLVHDDEKREPGHVEITATDKKEGVEISLLVRKGEVPKLSGLNWGQRKGREPNQAYISISAPVQKSGFFPEIGKYFTLHTVDGEVIIVARRQVNGKAIHSTESNSILGKYFRRKLGVPLGTLVTKEHLERYGRTSVNFYKLDDENYRMDFERINF